MSREPTFHTDSDGDVSVLRIEGEVDVLSASQLRDRLAELCEAGRPLVVDLSETAFMDSMALSVLVLARRRAVERGLALVLAAPQRPVRLVLEVSALDQFMAVYASVADAGAAVAAHPQAGR